jgi:NADPH-dependent 2,4-dienoyl-CoA reductase/sulfur reductase-like enzyme
VQLQGRNSDGRNSRCLKESIYSSLAEWQAAPLAQRRARRISEESQIIVFDRGPYVSFANCGLAYYVGNIIKDEEKLLVATPEMFKRWFNIEIRTNSEVMLINRQKHEIRVKELLSGSVYEENYDVLVLSPGASPIRPPLPG